VGSGEHRSDARRRLSGSFTASLLPVLLFLGSCSLSDDEPSTSDPWSPGLSELVESVETDLGRELLADGELTWDDYDQATQVVVKCVTDKGADLLAEKRYGTFIFSSAEAGTLEVLDECDSGEVGQIRSFYESRYRDPEMEGEVVLIRCLQEEGLLVEGQGSQDVDARIDELLTTGDDVEVEMIDACLYDPYGWDR
jgi:hypothetical protein